MQNLFVGHKIYVCGATIDDKKKILSHKNQNQFFASPKMPNEAERFLRLKKRTKKSKETVTMIKGFVERKKEIKLPIYLSQNHD